MVKVAPLVRLPIARTQVFSYWSEVLIARGSLVEIPFYNRLIPGIVMESRGEFPRQGGFQLKKIRRVVEKALLSEKQIRFAKALSEYYLSPLGTVLKFMVPKIAKAKKKDEKHVFSKFKSAGENKTSEEIVKAKDKEVVLIGSKDNRDDIIISVMRSLFKKRKQCLYLASEIFPAVTFFERIKPFFPAEEIVLIHGNISKSEIYKSWNKIKSGEIKIVISSKIGVFLPFRDFGTIIIEESGDISHKQWNMNPRYNAVKAVQILAGIHKVKIIYSNSLPSIEIWRKIKKGNIKIIDINTNKPDEPEIKIANIFLEKNDADFPIGRELYELLSKTINKKGKALLIVNRRGFSSFSVCRNCKNVFRCPTCERALVYFEEKEKYGCLHCSYKADLLSACPTCGACQFSHRGIGIQLVEKRIRRLFPSARILRLDADISKSKKKNEKILKDLISGNFEILIGTQIALKLGDIAKFSLVSFPSFEDLGSVSDFNTRELVFAMLNQARSLVGRGGSMIIQTTYPDDFLLTVLQDQKQGDFFEKEIKERKKMDFPPSSQLVKIFCREKSKKKVEAETKKVFDLLMTLRDSNIDISEPYEPSVSKKRLLL